MTARLRVTLRDVTPAVVRVLDVHETTTLPELHDLLQAALGWTNSHLHQFVAGDRRWGVPDEDSWDDDELDEATATLRDLPAAFDYLYDFGDSWEHDVELLGPGGERPGLVEGSGDCPPEDVGGTPGYERFLAVLQDPSHSEHLATREWSYGIFRRFDAAATDDLVRRVAGAVPRTVSVFLDTVGTGLKLTQAGKVPPAVVAELVARIPSWQGHYGSVREDNVSELWMLKDYLRKVGLLRVSKGQLLPTKASSDEVEVVRRLRRGFPNEDFQTVMTTSALAVLSAEGPQPEGELMARVLPMMGHGWRMDGRELDELGLRLAWARQGRLLRALDLLQGKGYGEPQQLGPSGLTLLPAAAGLADYLSRA